jgi:hypothetical protein
MKRLITSVCLFWLLGFSGIAYAQEGEVNNGYWLNGGRMMQVRNGELVPLADRVALPNGLTLLPNGELVTRAGVRRNLQPGQAIDASGRILFPQTQRNGSVILVPRSAYIVDRDPGMVRNRQAARPGRLNSTLQDHNQNRYNRPQPSGRGNQSGFRTHPGQKPSLGRGRPGNHR